MCLKRIFCFSKLQSEISRKQRVLRGLIGEDEELLKDSCISEELLNFSPYHDEYRSWATSATSKQLSDAIDRVEQTIARRWREFQSQEGYLARQLVAKLIDSSLLTENDSGRQTSEVIYHRLLPGISLGYKKNIQSVLTLCLVTKALEDWLGKISKKAAKQLEKNPNALLEPVLTELLTKERAGVLAVVSRSGDSLTEAAGLVPLVVDLIPKIFEKQGWTQERSGLTEEDLFHSTKENPTDASQSPTTEQAPITEGMTAETFANAVQTEG